MVKSWKRRHVFRRAVKNGVSGGILAVLVLLGGGYLARLDNPSLAPTPEIIIEHADLAGRVTHIRDGDTIEVSDVPVRIANLDCEESGTPGGEHATRAMMELVRSASLSCDLSGRKSWDREVGQCRLADGRDIGEILIAQGICARWR